ncbi:hypothetical protein DF044_01980 [Burkholderia contaminans]|uniref:hypothetical protein n=1 Tax=Burkholderia TaxID=32008 RepID=UPI0003484364|nr:MULTISPECIES: hypothetical protein [Burkholderia]MBF3563855.1 hypothetical protein [Burkholderia pseudomallei]PNW97296.1 hypothetical protein CF649_27865 [Burkholderia sp. 136(2017)]PNX34492.1 hypothetical protein CF648_27870 [Burkholderia sp. 137]RQT19457.1 hypothetical protein DF044_01980 [Burkholderia contaminans]CAJ3204338.1 Uncharacterised protein [Burkholderia pseudomallei]
MSTTTTRQAPPAKLEVTLAGEKKSLFMSFGLLNELCRGIGDAQGALQVTANSQLRDFALMVVLSDRDEEGNVVKPINVNRIEMSIEDGERLLDWVAQHATDFFVRTMERIVTGHKDKENRLKALKELAENPAS